MDRCNNVEQRKHSVIMQSRCCDFMQVRQDYGLGRPCSRSCNGLDTARGSYQCLIFPAHDIHQVDYAHQAFSHTKYRFNGRYAHVQSSRARGLSAELAFRLSDLLARSKSNSGSHNRRLSGDPTRVGRQMIVASRLVVITPARPICSIILLYSLHNCRTSRVQVPTELLVPCQ